MDQIPIMLIGLSSALDRTPVCVGSDSRHGSDSHHVDRTLVCVGSDSRHVDRTLVAVVSPPRLKEHSNILIGYYKAISGAEIL